MTTSEIVTWLRHIANFDTPQDPRKGCREAADRLEALQEENKRLREALNRIAHWNDFKASNAALEEAAKVVGSSVDDLRTDLTFFEDVTFVDAIATRIRALKDKPE